MKKTYNTVYNNNTRYHVLQKIGLNVIIHRGN